MPQDGRAAIQSAGQVRVSPHARGGTSCALLSYMRTLALALACVALATTGCAVESEDPIEGTGEEALVGGTPESRFLAAGYLASADGSGPALCGATLIAPNVAVTAAHCVYRHRDRKLAFGVGEVSAKARVEVTEVKYHPEAHLEARGRIDLVHTLLLNDLAYMILASPVRGVTPAAIPAAKPAWASCDVRLVGYGKDDSERVTRKGVGGCVVLNAKLGTDQIVEIRPDSGGAVCHRDGDEGHAAIREGAGGAPVLVGLYVGSVTGSLTDCRRYLQLLNGYEESSGHADFYRAAIADGTARLR